MDIEPGWDDDDEEIVGEDDEAKTRKTGKTTSSRHSKALSKRTGAAKSNRGGKKSVAGKSKISKASLRSKTIRSNQSRASKKTTTALSKRQEEESQPTFLNCSHYDKLIRIHSMLAMLSTDASKQKEYALDGHFFVMKIWEQSFMALNAATFFDEHTKEIQELGYSQADTASRREYFSEVITNGEINIPIKFTLPDKPEEWTNFSLPGELQQRAQGHEDKIMVAKWTFLKPELTYCHLKNLASILENHYFTIQLLPILKLIELFCNEVLENKILVQSYQLAQSRLMLNLGLKERGLQLKEAADKNEYKLTEEEIKVNYEKIKALKDEKDNLVDKNVEFE